MGVWPLCRLLPPEDLRRLPRRLRRPSDVTGVAAAAGVVARHAARPRPGPAALPRSPRAARRRRAPRERRSPVPERQQVSTFSLPTSLRLAGTDRRKGRRQPPDENETSNQSQRYERLTIFYYINASLKMSNLLSLEHT